MNKYIYKLINMKTTNTNITLGILPALMAAGFIVSTEYTENKYVAIPLLVLAMVFIVIWCVLNAILIANMLNTEDTPTHDTP